MTKMHIDVDDDLLEAAREVLGTTTKKDTVSAALSPVLDAQQRRRAVAELALWTACHEPLDRDARLRVWRQGS